MNETRLWWIRRRAYDLWMQAGSPSGRDLEFWLQAEHELAGEPEPDGMEKRSRWRRYKPVPRA